MTVPASRWMRSVGIGLALLVAGCGGSASPSSTTSAAPSTEPTLGVSPSPTVEATATIGPSASPTSPVTLYVVRKGDTLIAIAKKQHVTLAALRAANPQVTDPRKLHPGDKLSIPAH